MKQDILEKIQKQIAGKNEPVPKLNLIPSEKTWIEVKAVLQKFPDGCLVERKHPFLQTQFILDGAADCLLIGFDKNGKFINARPFYDDYNAPFSYLISEPYVVVAPVGDGLLPGKIAE